MNEVYLRDGSRGGVPFRRAAAGDSSRKIALDLNADGIIPPLKYWVLYRDGFSEDGAHR